MPVTSFLSVIRARENQALSISYFAAKRRFSNDRRECSRPQDGPFFFRTQPLVWWHITHQTHGDAKRRTCLLVPLPPPVTLSEGTTGLPPHQREGGAAVSRRRSQKSEPQKGEKVSLAKRSPVKSSVVGRIIPLRRLSFLLLVVSRSVSSSTRIGNSLASQQQQKLSV